MTDFELRGEHIALDALLKATGLAPSGGAAKMLITTGQVSVDDAVELRRGCKLRAGQLVALHGQQLRLLADPSATETTAPKTNPSAP
jgi:ribosome-associated protein